MSLGSEKECEEFFYIPAPEVGDFVNGEAEVTGNILYGDW